MVSALKCMPHYPYQVDAGCGYLQTPVCLPLHCHDAF